MLLMQKVNTKGNQEKDSYFLPFIVYRHYPCSYSKNKVAVETLVPQLDLAYSDVIIPGSLGRGEVAVSAVHLWWCSCGGIGWRRIWRRRILGAWIWRRLVKIQIIKMKKCGLQLFLCSYKSVQLYDFLVID
jgi:hypothetical protein